MLQRVRRYVTLGVVPLVLFVSGVQPLTVSAQKVPDLVVSLRDEHGAGVVASVVVRDTSGEHDVARATTNAQGHATIETLPVSEVRVAVEGSLPNGITLFQRGDDARGLLLWLDAGTTTIDLRIDPDGAVAPDPATIAQEGVGAEVALVPTAVLAATFEAPTARPTAITPRPSVVAAQPTPVIHTASTDNSLPVGSLALVGVFGLGIAGVLVLRGKV